MSELSPRLSLPYLMAAQAQKHVTLNEALQRLDLLTQLTVQGFGATVPPPDPDEGQVWALGPDPEAAWSGQDGRLAAWIDGDWLFLDPQAGWRAAAGPDLRVFDGAHWVAPDLPVLDNLPGVGINAAHDATNRLTVSAAATLLNHEGAGHQLKLNKAGAADTASLLFQTGWSGRAEMGTAGSDNFSVKVSPDGSTWHDGLTINRTTGALSAPNGATVTGLLSGTAVVQSATDTTANRLITNSGWFGGPGGVAVSTSLSASLFASDFNTLVQRNGTFSVAGAWANAPEAGSINGVLIQEVYNSSAGSERIHQTFRRANTHATLGSWHRYYLFGASGWSAWTRFVTQRNLLGTVSQSAGVPTGAVIERGTNANGEYVRFADGTQICTHALTFPDVNTANGAGFSSGNLTWTFPAAFAAIPPVSGGSGVSPNDWVGVQASSTTSAIVAIHRWTSVTGSRSVRLMAVGRWF